mmetsp:Transcript_16798/g.31839  ORF Transcript_16798/g.31839 Transcript_16798/m.31839 type:complete len:149 (+) Transcript_16798:1083-1529(+)
MRKRQWRALDELFAGVFDGMTYKEISEKCPEAYAMRKKNKLSYRYPRGESYLDVIKRVEQVMLHMQRHKDPVVIVAHQAILRVIYTYFMGKPREDVSINRFNSAPLIQPKSHFSDLDIIKTQSSPYSHSGHQNSHSFEYSDKTHTLRL